MFKNDNHTLVMPYGAYELKATYQRNMLIGMVSTTAFVIAILLSAILYSHLYSSTNVIVKPYVDDGGGIITLPPPIYIIPETPDINPGARREITADVGIPTPVADSLFADDDSPVIATIDEKSLITGTGIGPFTGNEGEIDYGSGGEGGYYGVGDEITPQTFIKVEEPPVMIKKIKPEYPRFCEMAGITGSVWIWALVDENGKVIKAEVLRSSGTQSLDEAALEAAYKNIYKPGIQSKRAIKVGVTYKVEFELEY